jgi:exo-beta-1,3-glucanase (GH17 family)
MNNYKLLLLILFISIVSSCNKDEQVSIEPELVPIITEKNSFSVNKDYILKNNIPFQIKGVTYVPGYPGYLPWEIEKSTALPLKLQNSIFKDISDIKAMKANVIRFWGAPKYCYEALKTVGDMSFIQVIWIQGDAPDFQNTAFKESTKSYIKEVIDRIYSVFNDNAPPLVAITIGNELSESSIISTNRAHPTITSFVGNYIVTNSNITATEAFIAEMADFARTYEFRTYGRKSLLTYCNEIRTSDIIDISFLDFISHNAYSYAVPYFRPNTKLGSSSRTIFQGWIEEIKYKHPNKPLLITETGLSVSPNAGNVGPPNYGYGGNTEAQQVTGLLQNIKDINTTALPLAGVCIHEYLDAWWKYDLQDSYSQDPYDIEEWFGLVKLKESNGWYTTEFRGSYNAVKNAW